MNTFAMMLGVATAALSGAGALAAEGSNGRGPGCGGPIPTLAKPIVGEALLARMRRGGCLPDTFNRASCRYDLGGDPGAAYYVKTCR
jgi:hypothetical protein